MPYKSFPDAVAEYGNAIAQLAGARARLIDSLPIGQPWQVKTANNYYATVMRRYKPGGADDVTEWVFVAEDGRSTITDEWPVEWIPVAQLVVP